jgi:O-glycosyl hydrolase
MKTLKLLTSAALAGLCLLLVAACTIRDKTTLDTSWTSPERPATPFGKVLVITVSRDEFVQAQFQDLMASRLQEKGMNAVASHRYFTRYVDEERERFRQAIEASDADGVLVARVTVSKTQARDEPDFGIIVYPTAVRTRADYTLTTRASEASLFDRATEKLVWSARVKTENVGTGDRDRAIAQYVEVLIDAMAKDGLF